VGVNLDGNDKSIEFLDVGLQIVILGNVASVEALLAQWTRRAFPLQDPSYTRFAE